MNAIIKLAWKNIWRKKWRSILMIGLVGIGVFAGTFVVAFINGWMENGIEEHLQMQTSHLQIHAKGYDDTNDIGRFMDRNEVEKAVNSVKEIASASYRLKTNALLTTAETSVGLIMIGVDANEEKEVSGIHTTIDTDSGTFLGKPTNHPVVISRYTARKLNARINSKIIVTFQDSNGDMQEVMLRVGGIFHTNSKRFDNNTAYMLKEDLLPYLSLPATAVHETAIILKHFDYCETTKDSLAMALKNCCVQKWDEVYPLMEILSAWREILNIFLLGIFFTALAFGIMNFMLMSVMEREEELNMLRNIGVSRRRIMYMIQTETLALISTGTMAGIALCLMMVAYFSESGFDISFLLSDNVNYGFSSIIHPKIVVSNFVEIVLFVLLSCFFASTSPVRKAIRNNKNKQQT